MVFITKIPGDNCGYMENPESYPVIYMTSVMETQCCIVTKKWKEKYELKQNPLRFDTAKKADRITKQGRSFEKIIPTLENICSDTETKE